MSACTIVWITKGLSSWISKKELVFKGLGLTESLSKKKLNKMFLLYLKDDVKISYICIPYYTFF